MFAQELLKYRLKALTLAVINVLQPVDKNTLVNRLTKAINTDQIDLILDELVTEHRITMEKDHYRVTYKGIKSTLRNKGRILRDVQRMEYLVKLSRKGGGT